MAYKNKYLKQIEANGEKWMLIIAQDTEENVDWRWIGPVLQSLRLVMQGDQADVDTPIVKTSLEMTFVDASDIDGKTKTGFWEEFYTSSATEYQVRLYKGTDLHWTGYITPDSFSEDLRYRGSVSIIARDNLGTLQDTTCDCTDIQNGDGKVFIYDIIDKAFKVSTCGMALSYDLNAFPFAADNKPDAMWENGGNALWHLVDAAALSEYNWWEALEKVLYSIGACMRYIGGNQITIVPLRDLPKCGEQEWWDVPVMPTRFLAFGHRELVPGVKNITETQEWETEIKTEPVKITEYEGTETLPCTDVVLYAQDGTHTGPDFNVPVWGYENPIMNESIAAGSSALLNVQGYEIKKGYQNERWGEWDDSSILYMAVNAREERPITFKKRIFTTEGTVSFGFRSAYGVTLTPDYKQVLNIPLNGYYEDEPPRNGYIYYRVYHISDTTAEVKYYNASSNSWETSNVLNYTNGMAVLNAVKNYTEFEVANIKAPSTGIITLEIVKWAMSKINIYVYEPCVGIFGRLSNIHIDVTLPEEIELTKKRTITTNYSDRYAVRLTRDPEFAINETTLPEVAYLPNAILNEGAYQYRGLSDWIWLHGMDPEGTLPQNTGISLTRLIHQQLLAYHASPNNTLSGELIDVNYSKPFATLYEWGGVKHMLMSGAFNILTGRMESAVLRSFTRYDRMWETYIEEGDVIEVPYSKGNTHVRFHVVSDKQLMGDDMTVPEGVENYGYSKEGKRYYWSLWVAPNNTGEDIEQVVKVDTAKVLLRRLCK